ncbi:MAG: UDP-2,3-diacylglucosamine diphosphatase LpxI [Candidatus Omnitrophica bacterium]|nr:UDP-2,3-diacylglucosamine diphosphatase LpxI [Candidatus Omnitrophota bacterium]
MHVLGNWWKTKAIDRVIGLIAGQGELPILFAKAASSLKREVVTFGVEGQTDRRVEALSRETHYVRMGELARLAELLKSSHVKRAVLAGGLPKREIYNPSLTLDQAAKDLLQQTSNRGDDHLLRAFRFFLKAKCGVSVVDSRVFLKEVLVPRGVLTRRAPTEEEWKDLRFGRRAAKMVGGLDIGQTVVVKKGVVLAVEAIEGTDAAIRRGGELGGEGAVVVKTAKPRQDLRFDLPCVGVETLHSLKAVSSRVLGLEAGKALMLFKEEVLRQADGEGITIVGLS